jgi:hypothetical protein
MIMVACADSCASSARAIAASQGLHDLSRCGSRHVCRGRLRSYPTGLEYKEAPNTSSSPDVEHGKHVKGKLVG